MYFLVHFQVNVLPLSEGPGGYEIREYPAAHWISTDSKAVTIHDSRESQKCFWKLFRYISGENEGEVKIPMTAPVTHAIYPGKNAGDKSKFTMSFYLGEKYQEDPPKPTEEGVYIESRPAMKVNKNILLWLWHPFLLLLLSISVQGCCSEVWGLA